MDPARLRSDPIDRRRFRRWVTALRDAHPDRPALSVAASVAQVVADELGLDDLPLPTVPPLGSAERPDPPWCSPRLPGLVYEALLGVGDRRRQGSWFTPVPVVDGLVALALDDGFDPGSVLDPACGGGAFLLGVADRLHRRGSDPADVIRRLRGVDLDPAAVEVTRWGLALWAAVAGADPAEVVAAAGVRRGDGLGGALAAVDLVVGNPPFATPLRTGSGASDGSPAARYRQRHPHLGPYADAAACFLDRGVDLVADGGRLVLVLPQSLLAGRDSDRVLERLRDGWRLRHLWVPASPVFEASVHVFAPVLQRAQAAAAAPAVGVAAAAPAAVGLHGERSVRPVGAVPAHASWADAAATALGVPPPPVAVGPGTLADFATATSGFRDQHYGLAAACREAADGPGGAPLVTVGQIDPLRWRRNAPIRFAGHRWDDPVVDLDRLSPPLAAWVERQRRPKVLLATQTRVLEPLIDRSGQLVPATPVIAVHAAPEDLGRVAALLLAPPVSAWAARRGIGTALQPAAIKLAARQVLEIPLPGDDGPWREAAGLLAPVDADRPAGHDLLHRVAVLMCEAYGAEDEPLLAWWGRGLPRRDPLLVDRGPASRVER